MELILNKEVELKPIKLLYNRIENTMTYLKISIEDLKKDIEKIDED